MTDVVTAALYQLQVYVQRSGQTGRAFPKCSPDFPRAHLAPYSYPQVMTPSGSSAPFQVHLAEDFDTGKIQGQCPQLQN